LGKKNRLLMQPNATTTSEANIGMGAQFAEWIAVRCS
jgi:hypothetical protein